MSREEEEREVLSSRNGNMKEWECSNFSSSIREHCILAFLMPLIPMVLRCSFLFLLLMLLIWWYIPMHVFRLGAWWRSSKRKKRVRKSNGNENIKERPAHCWFPLGKVETWVRCFLMPLVPIGLCRKTERRIHKFGQWGLFSRKGFGQWGLEVEMGWEKVSTKSFRVVSVGTRCA